MPDTFSKNRAAHDTPGCCGRCRRAQTVAMVCYGDRKPLIKVQYDSPGGGSWGADATAFPHAFWEALDLVITAVDSVEARTYVDQLCKWYMYNPQAQQVGSPRDHDPEVVDDDGCGSMSDDDESVD